MVFKRNVKLLKMMNMNSWEYWAVEAVEGQNQTFEISPLIWDFGFSPLPPLPLPPLLTFPFFTKCNKEYIVYSINHLKKFEKYIKPVFKKQL